MSTASAAADAASSSTPGSVKHMERLIPEPYMVYRPLAVSDVCEHGFVEYVYPKNDLRTRVLEFEVEGNTEHLIVPNGVYLKLSLDMVRTRAPSPPPSSSTGDGATGAQVPPPKFSDVGVVNHLFGSLFESVEVKLGNADLSKSERNAQYTSYLSTLMNYDDRQDKFLRLVGFCKDEWGQMNCTQGGARNSGWEERAKMFNESTHRIELVGRVHGSLFFQKKVLPTQTSLRVVMRMCKREFYMMHAEELGEYDLELRDAVLMVQKVSVVPGLREGYNDMFAKDFPVPYVLTTPYVTHYAIDRGSSQYTKDNLFSGRMPLRVLLVMVKTEAYHGRSHLNPFNFEDFGLVEVCLYKDGVPYPRPPIRMDVAKAEPVEAYFHFLASMNAVYSKNAVDITLEEYAKGYFIVSYNMSPDQSIGSVYPGSLVNAHSNVRLEMKFGEPLKENVTLLVYYEYQHLVQIDRGRAVRIDY